MLKTKSFYIIGKYQNDICGVNLKERDSYNFMTDWLSDHYYVDKEKLYTDSQIYFGSIKARCDVLGYYFESDKSETPACKELTAIHLMECKVDWAASQAYGQLLFYEEIVDRYLRSKHYDSFNLNYWELAYKFYQRNERLPWSLRNTFRIANEIDLWLHFVVLTKEFDTPFFNFLLSSLDNFLEGKVGFLALIKDGSKWKPKVMREPKPIRLTRKTGPKPINWMEPFEASILPPFPTRIKCQRFTKEGKRNYWCKLSDARPDSCEACLGHF